MFLFFEITKKRDISSKKRENGKNSVSHKKKIMHLCVDGGHNPIPNVSTLAAIYKRTLADVQIEHYRQVGGAVSDVTDTLKQNILIQHYIPTPHVLSSLCVF